MKSKSFLLILVTVFAVPAMALAAPPWTAAGPTAVIDEASLGAYWANPQYIGFSPAGATGDIVAYFNVTDTTATGFPTWNTLEMSYFDNSPSSQITAKLIRLDKCNGSLNVMCTVTGADIGFVTCARCTFGTPVDFTLYNYYVSVSINRTDTTTAPKLFGVRLF